MESLRTIARILAIAGLVCVAGVAAVVALGLPSSSASVARYVYDESATGCGAIACIASNAAVARDFREICREAGTGDCKYDDRGNLARASARFDGYRFAPKTTSGSSIVRFDPQWASRQLAGQNLPGSTGWATTPGGRTLSMHAAERTFVGGPGRAPIDPGLVDDILTQGTRVAYRGLNDTIRISAPSLCGRCYAVVDAQNVNHVVTVMVPK